jgi:hypothetical protein
MPPLTGISTHSTGAGDIDLHVPPAQEPIRAAAQPPADERLPAPRRRASVNAGPSHRARLAPAGAPPRVNAATAEAVSSLPQIPSHAALETRRSARRVSGQVLDELRAGTAGDLAAALNDIGPYFVSHPDVVAPALAALIRGEVDTQRSSPDIEAHIQETDRRTARALNVTSWFANAVSLIGMGTAVHALASTLTGARPWEGLLASAMAFGTRQLAQAEARKLDPMADFFPEGGAHDLIHDQNRELGPPLARIVERLGPAHRAEPLVALCRMPMATDDKAPFLRERLWPMINQLPTDRQLEPLVALLESPGLWDVWPSIWSVSSRPLHGWMPCDSWWAMTASPAF